MSVCESGQDYLEAILVLENRKGIVHSVDVAQELDYSKASVSVAMKALVKSGHIVMGSGKELLLTDSGRALAEFVYQRHIFLKECFTLMGVDPETAERDACRIEHDLSCETFEAIKKYVLLRNPHLASHLASSPCPVRDEQGKSSCPFL